MAEVEISLSNIEAIELSRKPIKQNDLTIKLSPLGDFESHNVLIKLKKTNTLKVIYGKEKEFISLGLHVDEPENFKTIIEKAIIVSLSLIINDLDQHQY